MPYRKTIFTNDNIYHVMNRGAGSIPIFLNKRDYQRFLQIFDFLRFDPSIRFSHFARMKEGEKEEFLQELREAKIPLVEILAFSLMPNHFHLLLKQLIDSGIQTFMGNLQNSYAKYFNTKHNRKGHLFQSAFRSVYVETDEQLKHVSRYIHLNPVSSNILKIDELKSYPYDSFGDYCSQKQGSFINTEIVLSQFKGGAAEYENFVFDQADYQRALEIIKHMVIE